MLWVALFLPELPLQLAQRASKEPSPHVVADGPATRPVVLCASTPARELGIEPGMPVAAARALVRELAVLQRNPAAETQALQNLAGWAYQFTSAVVVQPAEGLVLEVGASLRLHGGLSRLIGALRRGIAALGYHAEPGVAPTPLAAWLLAKARHAGMPVRMCTDAAVLPERLSDVPLALLEWPDEVLAPLRTLGIRRVGQCLKLPRDGFIRRFGHARRLDLDKATGAAADPRVHFVPPDTFSNRTEFGFEVSDALALLFPLKRLLQELEGFLRGRGAGVQQWQLRLEHLNHGRTTLTLGVVAPERSAERFLALARERLTQTTLMAPVLAMAIAADRLLRFEESNRSWIPDPRSQAIGWNHLVDRLTTRLGPDKVYGLRTVDNHRPEHGFRPVGAASAKEKSIALSRSLPFRGQHESPLARSAGFSREFAGHGLRRLDGIGLQADARPAREGSGERAETLAAASGKKSAANRCRRLAHKPRPLWLLRAPRSLVTENGRPLCQGQLRLIAGPERIESGWWDGAPARRDYYVARNPNGETFWVFREHRKGESWFLHGVFA